jgi:DNA-binding Xre family transcriptional regulator
MIGIAAEQASNRATTFDSFRHAMIKLIVREVAERAGIKNPLELSKLADLPYETVRRAWNDDAAQIGLKTIERLCDALQVMPGQIFQYVREADRAKGKGRR